MNSNKPFLLAPVGKDYLWGGEKLKKEYGKDIDMTPLAETWECSTHPDGISMVASGEYAGMNLKEVLKMHPKYLGTHHKTDGELPILVKFLDAQKDLSVQVHPGDEYANRYENGQLGKTEMWYVMDADENAEIIYGVHHKVEKETLRRGIIDGNIEKYLMRVPIKKNDVFLIRPGTIHALCKGALVAEIQENSNLTYRLYDYGRIGKDGKPRELHIEKALKVAILESSIEPRQPMRIIRYKKNCADELLASCEYFKVHRLLIYGETSYKTDKETFRILLCIDGGGYYHIDDKNIQIKKGDCLFVPADSSRFNIAGVATLIEVMS